LMNLAACNRPYMAITRMWENRQRIYTRNHACNRELSARAGLSWL